MRLVQEVRRALAGAADTGQLDDLIRLNTEVEERIDDALGDRVVAAPGAERRLRAAICGRVEADDIDLPAGWGWCSYACGHSILLTLTAKAFVVYRPSCLSNSVVNDRPSIGRP